MAVFIKIILIVLILKDYKSGKASKIVPSRVLDKPGKRLLHELHTIYSIISSSSIQYSLPKFPL